MHKLNLIVVAAISTFVSGAALAQTNTTCQPQCVPYARQVTGISATAMPSTNSTTGNYTASAIWDNAKLKRRASGQPSVNSLLLFKPFQTYANSRFGHTAAVTQVKFVSGSSYGGIYDLYIKQSNAGGRCQKQEGWARYDENTRQVTFKQFGPYSNVTLDAYGFVK